MKRFISLDMVRFQWTGGQLWHRFKIWLSQEWFIFKLTFWSLFYNSLTSWNVCIDTALEPMFWFVDHFVRYLGPAFVVIVVSLVFSVIIIFYVCLLPEKYAESYFWTIYHLVLGHWMLYNTAYHYFKACFTDPGYPPEKIPEVVSICKKCIAPKPPRTHHCSVCDKCVLKMDHHCPWLNNCVGHHNHRHFFLFCVYMWFGTIYVSISAYPAFKEHYIGSPDVTMSGYFYPLHILSEKFWRYRMKSTGVLNGTVEIFPTRQFGPSGGLHFHHFILYEFLLCSAVSIALGLLTMWHCRLITRGETSIEIHINKKERERLAKKGLVFKNPYSFGPKRNWQIFLGLTNGRTFWSHVLFPSNHKPDSDGLTWELSTNTNTGLLLL